MARGRTSSKFDSQHSHSLKVTLRTRAGMHQTVIFWRLLTPGKRPLPGAGRLDFRECFERDFAGDHVIDTPQGIVVASRLFTNIEHFPQRLGTKCKDAFQVAPDNQAMRDEIQRHGIADMIAHQRAIVQRLENVLVDP